MLYRQDGQSTRDRAMDHWLMAERMLRENVEPRNPLFVIDNDASVVIRIMDREILELNVTRQAQFEHELLSIVTNQAGRTIVLDMEEVELLSSAMLTALVRAHNETKRHRSQLRLINLNSRIRGELAVTRLDRVLQVTTE